MKKFSYITARLLKHRIMILLIPGIFFAVSCRHAIVEFDPIQPASCRQGFLRVQACEIEKAQLQDRIQKDVGQKHVFVQNFYAWGYYPRSMELDISDLCKDYGIRKVHQYTTGIQGFYSEVTLGIFVPRTTEVQCY